MNANVTYLARHATHVEPEIDRLTLAALDLVNALCEVQGLRSAYPTKAGVDRFNAQTHELAGLMEAFINRIHQEADDHGLEEDPNGKLLRCDGFDRRTWMLPRKVA